MAGVQSGRLAMLGQRLLRVQAGAFQQPVAARLARLHLQHRAAGQADDVLQHGRLAGRRLGHHLLRTGQAKGRRKHRQAAQRRLLGSRQHGVAPVERCTQAAVAVRHHRAFIAQQLQALVKVLVERPRAEQRQARAGHLQSQGQPVEPAAQRTGGFQVSVGNAESRVGGLGPPLQQLQSRRPAHLAAGGTRCWHRQRRQHEDLFTRHMQSPLRSHQQAQLRRGLQQRGQQRGQGFDQQFGGVQHQQHLQAGQGRRQAQGSVGAIQRPGLQAECLGDGGRKLHWCRQRCQIDPAHAVVVQRPRLLGQRHRQPGLADAARPDEGDQTVLGLQGSQLGELAVAAEHRLGPARHRATTRRRGG